MVPGAKVAIKEEGAVMWGKENKQAGVGQSHGQQKGGPHAPSAEAPTPVTDLEYI